MLAHSPKTTNLAAYASVGTSSPSAAPVTLVTCPDDSDFLDSDAEGETFEVEDSLRPAADDDDDDDEGEVEMATQDDSTSLPSIPLIYISNRLYYTYFQDPPPPPHDLNQGDGDAAAVLEEQQRNNAATSQPTPARYHWFNVDEDLVYLSFFQDWGPLNVALFYRFCMHVLQLLNDESLADRALVFYSSSDPCKKANTSLLAMMYSMIVDRIEPADAFHPFNQIEFRPFRDAGYGRADYYLNVQDILYGVHRAIKEGLLDLAEFNLAEYEHYEQVQNGDWNWLTPSFLAFASPNDREYVAAIKANGGVPPKPGSRLGRKLPQVFTNTIKYFKSRNVKLVVRLNNPLYDKAVFEEAGIAHLDLYFDDGSNPSEEILREFIRRAHAVIEKGGAIAVHCKAGLGRTGVLIGAYLVWRYGFSASEVIGFMRIMRPGCVVGPQQHFMYQNFAHWIRWSVQDQAIAIARKTIEAERAAMAAGGLGVVDTKRPLKRRSDEEDENAGTARSRGGGPATTPPPITPRARKAPHVIPATAAPAVKPVPCVGQPRKSPSPSRKLSADPPSSRLGGAAVAATAAATAAASHRQPTPPTPPPPAAPEAISIRSTDLPRSASDESLASLESKHALRQSQQPGSPSTVASLRNSWEAIAGSTTPRSSGRSRSDEKNTATPSSGRRVLAEAQRWNGSGSGGGSGNDATPTANRRHVDAVRTRSGNNHQRAQSENPTPPQEEDVFGPKITSPSMDRAGARNVSPPASPGTPSSAAAKRVPSFVASPHVRAAYGLKDSKSTSAGSPRGSPRPDGSGGGSGGDENRVQTTARTDKSSSPTTSKSDAEVLGVLGINGQENKPVKPSLRTFGRVPSSSNSISPAKIRPLPATTAASGTASTTTANAASAGANAARGPAGLSRPRPAPVPSTAHRLPGATTAAARPTPSTSRPASSAAQRSTSASSQTSNSSATSSRPAPRIAHSARSNGRLASSRGAADGMASKTTTTASVVPASSADHLAPVSSSSSGSVPGRKPMNRTGSGTVPISNSANAAMLAARSNLKRPRPAVSPEVGQEGFGGETAANSAASSRPPVSAANAGGAAARFGRNVRRRRSSLSAADIGMA